MEGGVVYAFKFKPSGVNDWINSIQWLSFSFLYSASSLWIFSMTIIDRSSREWSDRVKCLATGPSICRWLMSDRCPLVVRGVHSPFLQHTGWPTFYIQWGKPHSWFGSLSHESSRQSLYCETWFPFLCVHMFCSGVVDIGCYPCMIVLVDHMSLSPEGP